MPCESFSERELVVGPLGTDVHSAIDRGDGTFLIARSGGIYEDDGTTLWNTDSLERYWVTRPIWNEVTNGVLLTYEPSTAPNEIRSLPQGAGGITTWGVWPSSGVSGALGAKLFRAPDGKVWVTTGIELFYIFDDDGTFLYEVNNTTWNSTTIPYDIDSFFWDDDGTLYAGAYDGVWKADPSDLTPGSGYAATLEFSRVVINDYPDDQWVIRGIAISCDDVFYTDDNDGGIWKAPKSSNDTNTNVGTRVAAAGTYYSGMTLIGDYAYVGSYDDNLYRFNLCPCGTPPLRHRQRDDVLLAAPRMRQHINSRSLQGSIRRGKRNRYL